MAEGIGARLRGARERSRLTILQAAEKLHVDPDILEALEANDFAALGAPVFVKGHLRHYAQLVGESPEALFELYAQETRVPPPDLTRIPKPLPDDAGKLVAPAVLVVIGFAVAGSVWWVLSLSHHQWVTVGSRPVPVTVTAAAPVQQDQPVRLTQPVRLALAPAPARPAGRAGIAAAAASPAAAGAQIYAVLTYSADSWTEVYDATGRRLLYGMSTGPVTRKLEGVPPLSVMLGDASGVTIAVGGRATSILRFVRSDHTARFLIAADGRVLAAPPKKGG
ncbi:MAG TPA: RodZ domain-containing protein [Steroidobacteraceae bacterium]|jgi:cytoskeleton protein RodZ|nr:RodZ domain-containing protein [Steroidobacteraceae bacterium]